MSDKIYTKTGDTGETSLLGGRRVPKHHPRVEAYGNIDELNSYIGLIRSRIEDKDLAKLLINIQLNLYKMASLIACDSCKEQAKLKQINDEDINILEKEIDKITQSLPVLDAFIIPGGNELVAFTHITRTVCRRAERSVTQLSEKTHVDDQIIIYLNRLSDYMFTLSRKFSDDAGLDDLKYISL
jgi:cob(I)alamin adenosyltransferase